MLGRKQEIDLKLNQLFDGIIVAIAFWLSHKLRFDNVGGIWPEEGKNSCISGFSMVGIYHRSIHPH
ncbi:MAG: hypothetical protein ACJ0IZ_03630 [Verrucomicrobiales bacterium]